MTNLAVIPGLDPASYRRHALHAEDRIWVEKNCYADVCIELLHALGLEPLAAMGFCAAVDFEGDCFTFFKPPHDELRDLFGVDVQELNVWLPLIEHARHHLGEGKLLSTEADAFHLPDTSGTDYQRNHVKTTIIICELDDARRRLGYFHNAAYYGLDGEDFDRLFRLGAAPDPTFLPLFAEVIRVDQLQRRPEVELRTLAFALLAKHVARRPRSNPITRFEARFNAELRGIQERGLPFYHAWAFATVRQCGAAFELLALHLQWLAASGKSSHPGVVRAAAEFERLSLAAKTFILKAARAVNSRKPFDGSATFGEMAEAWETGMTNLLNAFAATPPERTS